MIEFDLNDIKDDLEARSLTCVDAGSAEVAQAPLRWRRIAESADPTVRCSEALALWNREFINMVPRFAEEFTEHLADVRVCNLNDAWVLLYLARGVYEPYVAWVGWDPDTFGESQPPYWESIPGPLREFLANVHAGFTGTDGEDYGAIRPALMRTFSDRFLGNNHAAIADWDDNSKISSTRLVFVTSNGSLLYYCASPDLPPGKIALIYEGRVDTKEDFSTALDELMSSRFEA